MLHGDTDDEHGAPFTHKHPTDLDSISSSPSSGTPTFFDTRRGSKSSRHRSHTTTDGSTSSRLLERLVSREEEVREINAALAVTSERLEAESTRANAAERRALDYFHRLRIATENRERAEQESARLREELKLYKLQLENAQKEIFRAQDIIDQVAARRNEAEAEAARARTKARRLQEEKLVMMAREEGRRAGYREGLSMGRRISYDQENYYDENENIERLSDEEEEEEEEERNDARARIQSRSADPIRHPPMRPESAPHVRTADNAPPLPIPSPVIPVRAHTPSPEHRTPSPSNEPDGPETIHPVLIHPSPATRTRHVTPPPNGWIPRADSRTSYIPIPPPHGLQYPAPPSPGSVAAELQDHRATPQSEPTPVPPPIRARDYAYYQAPAPPPPIQRVGTTSLASRSSTHISQYELVNKRPPSALRNEIYFDRAGSGSQASRSSTRTEHRDQDRRHSDRTEAETIAEKWRADSDTSVTPPPRNPPRSATPRKPVQFYYRPQAPLEDIEEAPRPTLAPKEPRAVAPIPHPHIPLDDPASLPSRVRSPVDHFRERQQIRKRPSSASSGSIVPDIVVEPPSEPESSPPLSATLATQPELLSPEYANRPLPQDDPGQYQQSQPQYRPQSQPHHAAPSTHDRSGPPWPAGFVPFPSAPSEPSRDRPRTNSNASAYLSASSGGAQAYGSDYLHADGGYEQGRPPSASASASASHTPTRARAQSASSSVMRGAYEAAPLPPGVVYPAPPPRPHTSHRTKEEDRDRDAREHTRDRSDRDRDWDRSRDRVRDREWDRDRYSAGRQKVRDRERADGDWRRDAAREYDYGYDRERDRGRDGLLGLSPTALARPISLFDSDDDGER